jgi:putative spermidine/putrescine transport system permease protein
MTASHANRTARYSWTGLLLALPLMLFLGAVVAWPVAHLAARVLTAEGEGALRAVLAAGRYRTSLVNSLALSSVAAVVSVLLALWPAWVLAGESFRGRDLLRTVVFLPLTFSGVLVGFLMVVLLGRVGALPKAIGFLTGYEAFAGSAYTLAGLFVAYLYFEVPRAVVTLESAFRRYPRELDRAARALGAGPVERLVKVALPLAAPALRSTLAVTFSASMGSFGVALILSRRFTVAPLEIYTEMTGFLNDDVAGALCMLLALSTLAVDRLLSARRS